MKFLSALTSLCIFVGFLFQPAAASLLDKRVLLLYSYHPGFPTSARVLDGLRTGFAEDSPVIDIEYMDSKRLYDETSRANFLAAFRYKLSKRPAYDLVITADDNALEFMLTHGPSLLPNTPVVFLGVNNIARALALDASPTVTGVVEASSFRETIELVQSLLPARRHLHILVDETTSGRADLQTVRQLESNFPRLVFHVESLAVHSWESFARMLEELDDDDSILLLSAYRDKTRQAKSFTESLSLIMRHADVPIFHLWEHGMGEGILGGVLVSHFEQGRQAAFMARRILSGTAVPAVPVLRESPNVPIFDSRQLARFGVDEALLPEHAIVRYRPDSFWHRYRNWLMAAVIVFLALVGLSLYLARRNVYMNHLSQELAEKTRFMRQLMNTLPDLVWIKDPNGVYLGCNRRFESFIGASEDRIAGRTDFDFVPPEQAEAFTRQDRLVAETGEPRKSEESIQFHSDGHEEVLETVRAPLISENGELQGVLGIGRDITERKQAEQALHDREHLFRSVFNQQFQFMAILSPEGRVMEINDLPLRVLNVPRAAFIGELFWETPAWRDLPEWGEIWRQRLRQAAQQQEPVLTEDVYQVGAGELRAANAATTALRQADGTLTGFIIQASDISEQKEAWAQLAKAEAEWVEAMDHFDQAVVLLDMQRRLRRANKAFHEMFGTDPEDFLGRDFAEIVHATGEGEPCAMCRAQIEQREGSLILEAAAPGNTTGRPIEVTTKLIPDSEGCATALLLNIRDLSESREIDNRLRLAASVFDSTDEGIVVTDVAGNIIEVNRAFTSITGYSREEVIGRNPRLLQSGRHGADFYRDLWHDLTTTGNWHGEIWNRHKNGGIYPEWQNISTVLDHEGKVSHYVSVFSDISHIKESQERLYYLAHHDALTELPNRLLLGERVQQAIRHAQRNQVKFGLIFIDLDRFKHINDSFGHPAGDKVLSKVADVLLASVRAEDTVARIGGDEFVVLCEDIGHVDQVGLIARKLRVALEAPVQLDERSINVTASMGVCLYPNDGEDVAELLRNADSAMYSAKEQGRDTFQFYTEEMTRIAFERVLLENDLRQALVKQELRLFYQPQVDLQTGKLVGVEALIRWQHPELGLISPARFIPVAEDSGLIIPIGNWVLREACSQARCWLDHGLSIDRVAVNVAGQQIQRGELLQQVSDILDATGLPASRLELEVTENFIMQQAEPAIRCLRRLRELGVMLAIDDFGTGYSSLSYLKQLPVHKLKIDQSFVREIPHDADDVAIARAVIALAKELGLAVIAEGVETGEQAEFMRINGCEEAQGYLFSKPMPAAELEQWLQTRRA